MRIDNRWFTSRHPLMFCLVDPHYQPLCHSHPLPRPVPTPQVLLSASTVLLDSITKRSNCPYLSLNQVQRHVHEPPHQLEAFHVPSPQLLLLLGFKSGQVWSGLVLTTANPLLQVPTAAPKLEPSSTQLDLSSNVWSG